MRKYWLAKSGNKNLGYLCWCGSVENCTVRLNQQLCMGIAVRACWQEWDVDLQKKSTQKQNISINKKSNEMCKNFILELATKGLVFICQDSQCISETLFSFKTTEPFNLQKTHKEEKKWLYKQALIMFLTLLTLSSHCNVGNRKAYFDSEAKILFCYISAISHSGSWEGRADLFRCE